MKDFLILFKQFVIVLFIPKTIFAAVISSISDNVGETSDPFDYSEEDSLNIDLMIFSFLFIALCYMLLTVVYLLVKYLIGHYSDPNRISLSNSNSSSRYNTDQVNERWPSTLDDENLIRSKLLKLSPEEQFYYKQGEEYIRQNPPLIIPHEGVNGEHVIDPVMNQHALQFIDEEGVHAWEFQPNPNLPNDSILVENKTEVTFLNYNYDASIISNLPIPRIKKVYYFECKIFELNTAGSNTNNSTNIYLSENEIISFGLSTSPYPYFRLPGRHHHSISYDSNGSRRFNDSFELTPELSTIFPRCEKGDVIGIGYRTKSGTVFFTRNGKKLSEKLVGDHIKGWKFKHIYPIIGANVPCKIHVNFGTHGFVFIEANVKKWGYAKLNGIKLPPPSYDEYGQDVLLESGYEDEMSDAETADMFSDILDSEGVLLPPPPGFEFSTTPIANEDEFTLNSLPMEPPRYFSQCISKGTSIQELNQETSDNDQEQLLNNTLSNQFVTTD